MLKETRSTFPGKNSECRLLLKLPEFQVTEKMTKHLTAGASKVILSVPADKPDDVDATIVLGVNDHILKPEMKLISDASCTTIALLLSQKF